MRARHTDWPAVEVVKVCDGKNSPLQIYKAATLNILISHKRYRSIRHSQSKAESQNKKNGISHRRIIITAYAVPLNQQKQQNNVLSILRKYIKWCLVTD